SAIVLVILAKTITADIKGSEERKGKRGEDKAAGLLGQEGEGAAAEGVEEGEALEDVSGWKLLHGDVFRAPPNAELLAPLVGSGVQLLLMALCLVLLSAFGILNPSFRGGFVSVGVGLFVFLGLFSGYFSARVF